MTTAYCPGHITCFFCPVSSHDPRAMGSRGVGIKLQKGCVVTLEERSDEKVFIQMDGAESECGITRLALSMILPGRGFDVTVTNDLPVGQGFGMSAAGAVAACLCGCHIAGKERQEAFRVAHIAEIEGGGGLGDVAGIMCEGHIPMRITAGLPPFGDVRDAGFNLDLSVVTLGGALDTKMILDDAKMMSRITDIGSRLVDEYQKDPSKNNLFLMSRVFSKSVGLETAEIKTALDALSKNGNAGMCMLGHSIFTTVPDDTVRDILGEDTDVMRCPSTDERPKIIHS